MSDQRRERMAAMSGETGGGKAPKYNVPLIKFNGNTGEFKKISYDDAMGKLIDPLDSQISIVVLKNRKRLEALDDGLSSSEYNDMSQKVFLFKEEGGKYSREAVDTAPELKKQYPTIKTQEVLYVLFEGEVHKLIVKGGSSPNFYGYKDELKADDMHLFEVTTVIGSESEVNKKTRKKYFKMTFKATVLETSLDEVEEKMSEVDAAIRKIDDFNTGKLIEYGKQKGEIKPTAVIETEDDDINVDDIPFDDEE